MVRRPARWTAVAPDLSARSSQPTRRTGVRCLRCHRPRLGRGKRARVGPRPCCGSLHAAGHRLVIVELAEGPWLITRLEGTLVQRGEDVVVRYVGDGEGEAYPVVTAVHRNDT